MRTKNKIKLARGIGARRVSKNELSTIADVFRQVILTRPEFTADTIRAECSKRGVPHEIISKALPGLFKRFLAARAIKKTGRFILSKKDSQPVLIYSKTGKDL